MEFIYHFYIIEAILAIILIYILLLLIEKNNNQMVPQNDSKLLSKYKSLQSKHYALHKLSNKIIVEKTTLKSEFMKLTDYTTKLEKEKDEIEKKYNQAIKALDTNTYISNLKSQSNEDT